MNRKTRNKLLKIINSKEKLINIILNSLRNMLPLSEFNTIKNKIQSIDDNEYKKIKAIAISQLDKLDPTGRAARASATRRNGRGGRGGRKRSIKTKKYQNGGSFDTAVVITFGFLASASALATILAATSVCIKKSSDVVRNTGIFSRCFDNCKTDREEQEDRRERRTIRNKRWREHEIRRYRSNKKWENRENVKFIMNILKIDEPIEGGRTHLGVVQVSYLKGKDGKDDVENPIYEFTDVKTENLSDEEYIKIEDAKRAAKYGDIPNEVEFEDGLSAAADSWEANTGTRLNLVEEGDFSDHEEDKASSEKRAYWNQWLKRKDEMPYESVPPMNSRRRRSKSSGRH